ncbi:unnamed protein product [Menidia menidia]|uniref:(Atlantic silverside) hypothetical protein n=1 Tax=Menidia menidia TaxID=238744 RepID=A0A8S4BPD3_9TELE|nr:unnamed protein product [Menidia menidia]
MKRRGQTRGQSFVKADYYELDWYYEECTDGCMEPWYLVMWQSRKADEKALRSSLWTGLPCACAEVE